MKQLLKALPGKRFGMLRLLAGTAALWLAFPSAAPAAAGHAPDFAAALESAKKGGFDIAVLFHGSDWCHAGQSAFNRWQTDELSRAAGDKALLLAIDIKEHPSEAEKEAAERNKACRPPIHTYPAIAWYDANGRLVGVREGAVGPESDWDPVAVVAELRKIRETRDALWKRARGAAGIRRTELLGQGLDAMDMGLGPKRLYKPVFEEMKKNDPEDKSGYLGKYSFPGQKLTSMVRAKAKEKKFKEAERELTKWDANKRLTKRQRQELQAARFALYQQWPENRGKRRAALEAMRDVDPESPYGRAAARYLELLEEK